MTTTAQRIAEYASDFLAFAENLVIPSGYGPRRFGDVWADFQIEWFRAIQPSLMAVARGERPAITRFWSERTKGGSKDSDVGIAILWLLTFSPRPLLIQCGAADRDQSDELRRAMRDVIRMNHWLGETLTIQNWRIQNHRTDSECEILAADATGSHGSRPDVVIANELSHVTKWEFIETLADNLSKIPNGLGIYLTNAGFQGTPAFRWREIARTSGRWHFQKVAEIAPWLEPAEIEEAQRRNTASRFKRLWQGVWASGSGDAIDPEDIAAALDSDLRPQVRANHMSQYVAGLDLGIKRDHSALVLLEVDTEAQRIRLAQCHSWAPRPNGGMVDLEVVEQAVLDMHETFRPIFYFDPHQCQQMAQRCQRRHVRMEEMTFTGKSLNLMASCLMETFRSRVIDLFDAQHLVSDLNKLMIVEKQFGYKLTAAADETGHADRAIALAIALPAAVDEMREGRVITSSEAWWRPDGYSPHEPGGIIL